MHFSSLLRNDEFIFLFIGFELMVVELLMYKKNVRYSNDFMSNKNMRKHPLNEKYHLYTVKNLDVKKINLYYLIINLCCIVIGVGLMFLFNTITGVLAYMILQFCGSTLLEKYLSNHYPTTTE